MTRKEQLEFCQTCTKQKFTMQQGIVCSLTNEQASFQNICPDYIEDPVEKAKHIARKEHKREIEIDDESFGLMNSFGVKNGILAGQIAIGLAILWFVVGFFFLDRIFFYPIFLVIIGIISMNRGYKRKEEENVN